MDTTKKMTPQEFMNKLRERTEKMKAQGRANAIPNHNAEMMKKFKERIEKAKAEGKTLKANPSLKHSDMIARFRERVAKMKAENLKKIEVAEIEKKEN